MATVNSLRPLLDRKVPELCTPAPAAAAAAAFVISGEIADSYAPASPASIPELFMTAAATAWLYVHEQDAWIGIPASGLAGTFGAGSCGTFHPMGPTGTATAGAASTISTGLTIPRRLDGFRIRITGGTGAGQMRTIASNTLGASSVITVSSVWTTNPDATSTFVLLTGRFYVWNAGSASTFGLGYFDLATWTWTVGRDENLSAITTWGTDARLIATAGALAEPFATGTATAGAASTLTNSAKTWATNQWTNAQVRITAGTGAGQVRTIASNTGTVLTTSAVWTTNPDATSVYAIEGNDDHLYLMGNAAVALFRYSISGNTWTTLSPGVARSVAPGAGLSGHWIAGSTDSDWTNESAIRNGRYLYSFRGGASTVLDQYDIAANSWAAVTYGPVLETFTTGTSWAYDGDSRLYSQKDATGRFFVFDFVRNTLQPFTTLLYPQGAAVVGDKSWVETYTDGATKIRWVYSLINTSTVLVRYMVI